MMNKNQKLALAKRILEDAEMSPWKITSSMNSHLSVNYMREYGLSHKEAQKWSAEAINCFGAISNDASESEMIEKLLEVI